MRIYLALILCLAFGIAGRAAGSYSELQRLIEQERFADAAVSGEQFLNGRPEHVHAAFLTAYAYQMSAQQDKAIEKYRQIIADNPKLPEPRNNLAMIYLARGDYDRASQLLVQAINTHTSYATAYENLSRIYKGIASEAYRRAVNESGEPSRYSHNIELAAITRLESLGPESSSEEPEAEKDLIVTANLKTLLIERVKGWAQAWSEKNFDAYTSFYSSEHRANLPTHAAWVDYRRKRIQRPGRINIEVSDIQIKWLGENQAIIDFKQAFDSPGYSDRVVKRLGFSRLGSEWKITEERVLSVL